MPTTAAITNPSQASQRGVSRKRHRANGRSLDMS